MDAIEGFRGWLIGSALPLWAERGFDRSSSLFHEALAFDGSPVPLPRRVMVQARQISVYALAAERGWHDGRDLALAAGEAMIAQFWARDGRDGWAFAVDREGAVVDGRHDLYAHAFVLFGLAWLAKLAPGGRFAVLVARTLGLIEGAFADPRHGGYWDALPRPDATRRQDPHMHLLEAFLELHAATQDARHLDAAGRLVALARRAFIDEARGTVREVFDDAWRVLPAPGMGRVEPGHQFEWASLLRRFQAVTDARLDGTIRSLVGSALAHGTDRTGGRIVDEIHEDGRVRRASSRCWPHTEALKCLAIETRRGSGDYRPEIQALLGRLATRYCPDRLGGGWTDQLSATDEPTSRAMPASTLYHLAFAFAEVENGFA